MMTDKKIYTYRFRAEMLIDAINLRQALYKLQGFLDQIRTQFNPFNSPFKMAIVLAENIPDIEVILSTPYPIDFIKKAMQTIADSHVMLETLTEYDEYTGERTYDSVGLDIDLNEFWAIVDNTDSFFFTNVSLNLHTLNQQVIPYLSAMIKVQNILDKSREIELSQASIKSIESGSIIFETTGIGDAIRAIKDFFTYFSKDEENHRKLRLQQEELQVEKTYLENENEKLQLRFARKHLAIKLDDSLQEEEREHKTKMMELEIRDKIADIQMKEIKVQESKLNLLKSAVVFAETFAENNFPNDMPIGKRIELTSELVGPLADIYSSTLHLRIGRPDTLPEFPLSRDDDVN